MRSFMHGPNKPKKALRNFSPTKYLVSFRGACHTGMDGSSSARADLAAAFRERTLATNDVLVEWTSVEGLQCPGTKPGLSKETYMDVL